MHLSNKQILTLFKDRWGADKNTAYKMMSYLHNLLTINKIDYFIVSGTLLGYMRHGKLIPWDDDVDIMIFLKDLDKLQALQAKIVEDGYDIVEIHNNHMYKLFSPNKNNVPNKNFSFPFVDIFVAHTSSTANKDVINFFEMDFDHKHIYPIKEEKFHNIKVCIPNEPTTILNKIYGDDHMEVCVSPKFIHRLGKGNYILKMPVVKVPTSRIKRLNLL